MIAVGKQWVLLSGGVALLALTPGYHCAAQAPVSHVIQVSLDGLSAIHLQSFLAGNAAGYPNFTRLVQEGASTLNARCDYDFSETVPNHACMWLGRPVLQPAGWPSTAYHSYALNYWVPGLTFHQHHHASNPDVEYLPSVFDVVHDYGLSTAFVAGKQKLEIGYLSYNETHGAPDPIAPDNGRNKVDYAQVLDYGLYSGADVMNAVTNYLADHAPAYVFVHLAELDYWGHGYGWGTPDWGIALATIDTCLGSLFAAIAANPELDGQTALIVTTDHGGGYPLQTHVYPAHPLNYTIPFMVWGPGWPANANLYDLVANRFDPGSGRPDYNAWRQPLRNGDAPNLALALLGLPPIPGSSLRPVLGPKAALSYGRGPDGVTISWPSSLTGYALEASASLHPLAVWDTIATGITDDGFTKRYDVSPPSDGPIKFFRLRLQ